MARSEIVSVEQLILTVRGQRILLSPDLAEIYDLLLTEGGDPDKLGQGTLWTNELPECIHQNHIFRVRLTTDRIEALCRGVNRRTLQRDLQALIERRVARSSGAGRAIRYTLKIKGL